MKELVEEVTVLPLEGQTIRGILTSGQFYCHVRKWKYYDRLIMKWSLSARGLGICPSLYSFAYSGALYCEKIVTANGDTRGKQLDNSGARRIFLFDDWTVLLVVF